MWLQANECESFVQAVEAVERLHDFTPFIADLVDEGDRPNAARSYFAKVLYGPSLLATPASARPHHATTSAAAAPSGQMQQFDSEAAAQAHCPSDTVVWLNTNSGIYLERGMRWYERTKHGAYVCRKEADADGDRDTRNGQ